MCDLYLKWELLQHVVSYENLIMQRRKGIIARAKSLCKLQGMGLKTHEKGFTLDWNTENSSMIKKEDTAWALV